MDKQYHADRNAFMTVDNNLVKWGQKENEYRAKISRALLMGNGTQSLQQLKGLESEVARSYGKSPSEIETQKVILLLITNIKYMSYTLQTEHVVVGQGPMIVGMRTIREWESAVSACMTDKINGAGPLEMTINYGAGPGGWVLVAYIDCCFTA